MCSTLLGRVGRAARRAPVVAGALLLAGLPRALAAQTQISVPFTNGFIGTRGSSAGSANNVRTYATLGIARTFFIQNSSTNQFELQGNDIPGTLRIVRTNGSTIDMPASANWRNSGGTTYLIGILPRPAAPVTLTYAGGTYQITDGANPGGSSVGGYVAGYAGAVENDNANTSGNAASSQVLGGLNSYLATVVSSRPAGPVTVGALTTSSTTPTVTGTATLAAGEQLSVVVDGAQYTATSSPAVVRSGTAWSLTLASALAVGTHDVSATITNADGFTLSDATRNELVITAPLRTVTLAGALAANDKVYDGATAATGSAAGLALVGVQPGDQLSVAGVTLAFQSAAVGAGKTVTVTGVTLGGASAAQYTVDLAGAPTAAAAVTPRPLLVTGLTVAPKTYDGTTAAALAGTPGYSGLAAGESFAVAGTPTATFASAAAGTGRAVTVAGYAAPTANYTLTQPAGLTGTIAPRALAIGGAFTVADRPYDGTAAAAIATNALTLVGAVAGDTVELAGVTAAFASPAVGTARVVSITGASLAGAAAANYTVGVAGAPTTTASITAVGGSVTLGGALAANDKVYDGTTAATGSAAGLTLSGVQAGHQVSVAGVTLAFQTAAAAAGKTVVVTGVTLGGADAAQYTVALAGAPTATAAVTPRPLTIGGSFAAADKVADGTTAATITTNALQLVGAVAGDDVALGAPAAAFADAAVGANKPVTLHAAALTGAAHANYTVSVAGAPATTASITPATTPAPPSAPRGVVAAAGDRAADVAWTAPETAGCAAVSGYVAEYSSDGGSAWTRVALAGASPATLTGLVNNVAYRVRVAAVNACGTGPFAPAAAPVVPVAPTRDGAGQLTPSAPGTAVTTAGGAARPATLEVVQDTLLRVSGGAGDDFTLRLRALDQPGAAIPVDSTRTALLEQGGRAATDGTGFGPGSFVTAYLFAASRAPLLLGTAPVAADGSFAASLPVPDTLAAGDYTLQVNGIDRTGTPRAVALGVEVAPPPPELELTATPDQRAPVVGDTITITLTVTNAGRGPAVDVVIPRAFREPGFEIVRTTPLEGKYNAATHDWTIPRIERGAQARMLLTAVVLPPAAPGAPAPNASAAGAPASRAPAPSAPAPSSAPSPSLP